MLDYIHGKMSVAVKYGIEAACFLNNIYFWLEKNAANEKNFHDGRYWTYNSLPAFTKLFPFWTIQNIKTIIKKLKDDGVLLTGNYNQSKYDRTIWYSLTDDFIKKHYPESGILDHRLESTDGEFETKLSIDENQPTYTKILTQNTNQRGEQQHKDVGKMEIPDIVPEAKKDVVVDSPLKRYRTERVNTGNIIIPDGLKEEIEEKIGKITPNALKVLLSTHGEKKIREKLDNWHKFAVTSILNCTGFFISAVNNDYPVPQSMSEYIPEKHNYEQRKYDNDYLESLYENNKPGWGDLSKIDTEHEVRYDEIEQGSF